MIDCPDCGTPMNIDEAATDQADCETHVCPDCEYTEEVWF